ncbi:hypothetical protein PG984_005055 [Apiospora sp. TS-2023a]
MNPDDKRGTVALFTPRHRIGPWKHINKSSIEELLSAAERFGQAQDLLSLNRGMGEEELEPNIQIEIGTIRNHTEQLKPCYSSMPNLEPVKLEFTAGDDYAIKLTLKGGDALYVSIFRVDATGTVHFVSRSHENGIKLRPEARVHPIRGQNRHPICGLPLPWPLSFKGIKDVEEAFVFIVTDTEASLGFLETATHQDYIYTRGQVMKGDKGRGLSHTAAKTTLPRYDVVHIKYLLRAPPHLQRDGMIQSADESDESDEEYDSKLLTAACLPSPDKMEEGEYMASKGLLGAAFRGLTGVKPQVQVVNDHDEDITVVVSRYCAHRKLSGIRVDVSSMGFGLGFETTTFKSPATQKILVPKKVNQAGSFATFPLWTRRDGFGVITIFTGRGDDRKLFIENDMIRAGATAYFRGNANLEIVEPDQSAHG